MVAITYGYSYPIISPLSLIFNSILLKIIDLVGTFLAIKLIIADPMLVPSVLEN